jgi:tetratricopeptide (TPR) repeat protein
MDTGVLLIWKHPDGRTVPLRPMEARLLAYLRARSGQIVSTGELLRNVWRYGPAVRSRTVYTTVNRLRAAVEPDPHHPQLVVTVAGGGVRWMGDGAALPRTTPGKPFPRQVDRYVDRREAHLTQSLLEQGQRLVTLTGLAGIGKSRTAVTVATRVASRFVGGVEFTDLAGCVDAPTMHSRIAADLGIQLYDAGEAVDIIGQGLAARSGAIVVFDNAEHVGNSLAILVRRALAEPSAATLLVTSRTPLSVRGEHVVPVGPLSLVPDGAMSPAAALFSDRVRTAGIDLDPSEIETIVRRLDGIPLAIEFAAARARTLSTRELRRRLAEGTIALQRPPDFDVRHDSLDAAIEDSWTGLPAMLRRAMACLTVLGGAFSSALAEAVLDPDWSAPDVLGALVRHGMLQFDGTRYRFLAPVADFVQRNEPSAAGPAAERIERYLATIPLGEFWERSLASRRQLHSVAHLLSAAWVRAWNRGHADDARAILLRSYAAQQLLGRTEHASSLADEVIAAAPPAERATLLLERANHCTVAFVEQLGEAIHWASRAGDAWTEACARAYRGGFTGYRHDDDIRALTMDDEAMPLALRISLAARRYGYEAQHAIGLAEERLSTLESAVTLSRYALDPDLEVRQQLTYAHAYALAECGRYAEALAEIEVLRSWLISGAPDAVSRLLCGVLHGELLCMVGRPESAEELVDELLEIARRATSRPFISRLTRLHARVRAERGDAHASMALAELSVRGFEQIGNCGEAARTRRDRARIELFFGRPDLARITLSRDVWGEGAALHTCLVELMRLHCDLEEAFESVEEARVVRVLERAHARGARERAMSHALHAWWLAGNGDSERASEALARARSFASACGMQREEVERIARTLSEPNPRVPVTGSRTR